MTGDVVYYQCQIWFRQTVTRKCLWQFEVLQNLLLKLFGLFLFFPPVSHNAKHNLRSSKIEITVEGSTVFYFLLWHWELLGYMGCSQCQQSQSSMIAGQSISSSVAGLNECMNLPPCLSYFCFQFAELYIREGFPASPTSHCSQLLHQPHQSEALSRWVWKIAESLKLLKLWFQKSIFDVAEKISITQKWREKKCFSVTQSKYTLFLQAFLHLGGCPCFKPVHSELSMLFWSAAPSHNCEPQDYL